MTYVFVSEYDSIKSNCNLIAYGEDYQDIADHLDLPEGKYTVYQTDKMPDELKSYGIKETRENLQYVTMYNRTIPGA